MSVSEWIDKPTSRAGSNPISERSVFPQYSTSSVGPPRRVRLSIWFTCSARTTPRRTDWQPRKRPALGGANEKWHIHGGTDLLISGLIERLPAGTVSLGEKLVALGTGSDGGYVCTFETDGSTHDVKADHVVLALPFTTLRLVDLRRSLRDDLAAPHARHKEEPLGTNSKFFVQCRTRVWNTDHATGNAYCGGVVEGAWDATVYQPGRQGVIAALPGGTVPSVGARATA